MAWTTPRTWVANEVVTAALMNTHVRDNLDHLFDTRLQTYSYVVTLADADNTASEITIFTATITNAVADQELLIADMQFDILNNSGSAKTLGLDILYGGTEANLFESILNNNTAVGTYGMRVTMGRAGSAARAGMSNFPETNQDDWNQNVGIVMAAPTFTASQTFSIKATWSGADANTYIRPKYGTIRHLATL